MDTSDARKQALKEDFITRRGYWAAWHEGLLALNPAKDFGQSARRLRKLACNTKPLHERI